MASRTKKNKFPIDRKQSVYLDKDLVAVIGQELKGLWDQGFLDMSVGHLIKKRLRESYGIPGVKTHVK